MRIGSNAGKRAWISRNAKRRPICSRATKRRTENCWWRSNGRRGGDVVCAGDDEAQHGVPVHGAVVLRRRGGEPVRPRRTLIEAALVRNVRGGFRRRPRLLALSRTIKPILEIRKPQLLIIHF